MSEKKKLVYILISVLLLLIIGTLGYYLLTDLSLFNSFYMTIITVSTVGYKEIGELDVLGRLFTVFIIFGGLSLVFYAFTNFTSFLIEGELRDIFRRRSMQSKIEQLSNHYILCGAGETGHSVIEQFSKTDSPLLVVEDNKDKVNNLIEQGIMAIQGDATYEPTLHKAKIDKAQGLITSLPSDADNVLIVLTARELNQNLYIVSRAIEKNADVKLKRAGADNTISPNVLGGARMASLLLRPTVVSFLDVITQAGEELLDLEDVVICDNSDLVGKSLEQARIPERTGLIVLALKNQGSSELRLNPSSDEVLSAGNTMLVLGKIEQVDTLRELACDRRT
ncbi:potassium channel family protein [Natranaerobius trueperi]|uniref:Potassium channel protein n=1 Tax=Natranaerobius trueperi TaxID=759412 RepID=A0A226BX77_9FIRM|nr:potassium channel protein [Natranaerobius trueperi]OWZ82799.1 potassium channel protein [Natranaerobius trueperi]